MTEKQSSDAVARRKAEALRANLKRRKAATRKEPLPKKRKEPPEQ